MNLELRFSFENEIIPIDYRSFIVSFIKHCLEEYDEDIYKKMYNNDNPVMKEFTFSVYLPQAKFNKETIALNKKAMIINISNYNTRLALIMYNAFNNYYRKKESYIIKNNKFKVTHIYMKKLTDVKEDNIIIEMLSPIISRHHVKGQKDIYALASDNNFEEIVKENISSVIENYKLDFNLENLKIIPLKTKTVNIKLYNSMRPGNIGKFQLKGTPELLTFLYKSGIGSLRSSGFGHFKIIG